GRNRVQQASRAALTAVAPESLISLAVDDADLRRPSSVNEVVGRPPAVQRPGPRPLGVLVAGLGVRWIGAGLLAAVLAGPGAGLRDLLVTAALVAAGQALALEVDH